MRRGRRPSIFQVGRVELHPDGVVVITGWGLGLCATCCSCHRQLGTGQLAIASDDGHGRLGLAKRRPCDCCQSWTAAELADIVRDLADIEALERTTS